MTTGTQTSKRRITRGDQEASHLYEFGPHAITMLFNTLPSLLSGVTEIAEMNLICAYGLTGKHDIEIGQMLATLDEWASKIASRTRTKMSAFCANRSKYGSLAEFRVGIMIQTLVRDFGIHYNPTQIAAPNPHPPPMDDPEDAFIHGAIGPRRTGTCASLPVLLTALGRRLGYPLKLVHTLSHCFCRWDAPDERFNIDWHEIGLNVHSDEHYRQWPFEWNETIQRKERVRPTLLISQTPQQELAGFALHRAAHLDLVKRRDEAYAAASVAYRLWPTYMHGVWMNHLLTKKVYCDRDFPHQPCEETASKQAMERLAREKGAQMMQTQFQ